MLSKCLWKMFSCDDSVRGPFKQLDLDTLLDSLLDAIDALPQRRDSRSEPIFEPHYKLVTVVHKLVRRGALEVWTLCARHALISCLHYPTARRRQQDAPRYTLGSQGAAAGRQGFLEALHLRSASQPEECRQIELAPSHGVPSMFKCFESMHT